MNRAAISTVRKLLRVAKRAHGNEASVARQLAHDLMVRHRISVGENDGDELTHEVASAARDFWREQLLVAVAEAHACLAGHSPSSTKKVLIRGDRADVAAALRAYRRATHELRTRCALSLISRGVTALRRHAPAVYEKAIAVYTRVFYCTAITEIQSGAVQSVAVAAKTPREAPQIAGKQQPDGDALVEVDLLLYDIDKLAALVGKDHALALKKTAESDGAAGGRTIAVRDRMQLLLSSRSTVPNEIYRRDIVFDNETSF